MAPARRGLTEFPVVQHPSIGEAEEVPLAAIPFVVHHRETRDGRAGANGKTRNGPAVRIEPDALPGIDQQPFHGAVVIGVNLHDREDGSVHSVLPEDRPVRSTAAHLEQVVLLDDAAIFQPHDLRGKTEGDIGFHPARIRIERFLHFLLNGRFFNPGG